METITIVVRSYSLVGLFRPCPSVTFRGGDAKKGRAANKPLFGFLAGEIFVVFVWSVFVGLDAGYDHLRMVVFPRMHAEALGALDAGGIRRPAVRSEAARFVETGNGVSVDVGAAALLAGVGIAAETGDGGSDAASLIGSGGGESDHLLGAASIVVVFRLLIQETVDVVPVGGVFRGQTGPRRDKLARVVIHLPAVLTEPLHDGAELIVREFGGVVDVGDTLLERGIRERRLEVGFRGRSRTGREREGRRAEGGKNDRRVVTEEVGPTDGTGVHLGQEAGEERHHRGRRVGRNRALTITDSEEIANSRGRKGGTVRNAGRRHCSAEE